MKAKGNDGNSLHVNNKKKLVSIMISQKNSFTMFPANPKVSIVFLLFPLFLRAGYFPHIFLYQGGFVSFFFSFLLYRGWENCFKRFLLENIVKNT